MSSTTSIPSDYQNGNPLLYTFRDYHTGIHPYFILPIQFLIFDFSLRFWDKAVYDTWLLPMEFIEIQRDEEPEPLPQRRHRQIIQSPPKPQNSFSISSLFFVEHYKKVSIKTKTKGKTIPIYDLYDLIFSCLPLLAHAIWYCVIQSNCMSGDNATLWNCYNLFGYRIYNYLLSPFISFTFNFISKTILIIQKRREGISIFQRKQKWRRITVIIIFFLSLIVSIITFLFVGGMILPYFFTNAFPMIIIYCFIVFIYIYIFTVINIFLKCYTITTGRVFSLKNEKLNFYQRIIKKLHYNRLVFVHLSLRLFPYLMSILFNLSQYFYYGETFWNSLSREASSRDPTAFFDRSGNSSQLAHTALSST
ncbi:hypothetical protein I4U23_005855 [Adineta vaga]|nr:hypothetical protein I4U23_005855 [Adineta vaga]